MSNLLHSKTFRSNLAKWIALYILTLLIVTGVVTYSKYISSMTAGDAARTAKFKVEIEKGDICSTSSPDLCNLTSYKPYDRLEYKFTIDTTKVEVLTDVVININIDPDFEVISLNDVDTPAQGEDAKLTTIMNDGTELTYEEGKFRLVSEAGPSKINNKEYKLKLKFKKNTSYNVDHEYNEIVNIGYSATQKN